MSNTTHETKIAMVADGRIVDAKRIAACVNACEGISNEALISWMNPPEGGLGHPHGPWPAHIISLQHVVEEVAQQRDDLVEAIRLTLDENGHLADGDVCTLKRLKDALAKVCAGDTAVQGDMLLPANAKVIGAGTASLSTAGLAVGGDDV